MKKEEGFEEIVHRNMSRGQQQQEQRPQAISSPPAHTSEGAFGGPARDINGKQTDTVLKYGLN